jgi:menaquinone-dependent protoporphyrinogen oxidase
MRVLVSTASKHGATAEIGADIARVLREVGIEATELPADDVRGLDGYDAAIVGSGVYAGHWLGEAKQLLHDHREAFVRMPVWLFSSGPIGDTPKPVDDPVDAAPMAALVGARGHRVFAGAVDKKRLGFGERAILVAVRAPEGDFRPWLEIEEWAREIAATLHEVRLGTPALA